MSELKETEIGLIPKNWESVIFKELYKFPSRNGLSRPKSQRSTFGFKMVNMGEIFSVDRIGNIEMERVNVSEKEFSFLLEKNDLLFARQSLVFEGAGKCSIFVSNEKDVTFESHIIRVRLDEKKCNPIFYYYFFNSKRGKLFLRTITEQAVVAGIRGSDLSNLIVPLPTLPEQDYIADLFSKLDNKIDLLRRQNETLEQIAQTLFKRWFVEFEFPFEFSQDRFSDSVQGELFDFAQNSPNEAGKPYKSSGGTMVPSELGEIPAGWRVGTIGELASISKRGINPSDFPDNEFYHYSFPAFDEGNFPKREIGRTILSNKFLVESNSILVSKLNPSIPRIWAIQQVNEDKSICSTEFQVIKPNKREYYTFLFYLFKSRYVSKEMAQRATGTSGSHQRIRPDDILSIEIVIPNENMMVGFYNLAINLLIKKQQNIEQIQTLTRLRDTLLPKLMSGKIRTTGISHKKRISSEE